MNDFRQILLLLASGALAGLMPAAFAAEPLPALDLSINKSFGTTRREEVMLNRIVPYAGAHLGGVHVDTSKTPNRFYVFDSLNNRVLGYNGFKEVTLPNGPFPPADIVIGQPALWDAGAANGDCTRVMQPTAATLALVPYPWINSTAECPSGGTMATDTNGNFYIVDKCNNRVLKYNDPFATDQIADEIWGQNDFTSRVYGVTSASSIFTHEVKEGGKGGFTSGVDVEPDGTLWVADSMNNRVLRFPQGAKTADLVLGQATFTNRSSGADLHQMYRPQCVRWHPKTGEVFVMDGESYNVHRGVKYNPCRVLVFTPPFHNGMHAQREVGKSPDRAIGLQEARGFAFDPFDTNMVWVLDGAHGRILKFNHRTGAVLDWIGYRSTNYYGTHAGGDGRYQRPGGSAGAIRQPDGDCGFDNHSNFYFTACYGSAPIVRIPMPLQRNGRHLTEDNGNWVIASGEMMKSGMNVTSGRTMQDNYGMSRWGTQLYLNDGASCRLLVWTNYPAATTFQRADLVIGQSDFTSKTPGGTFEGRGLGAHAVASNLLFIATDAKLFVFQLPFTHGGRDYAPYKTVDVGHPDSIVWDDDGAPAYFSFAGIAYDAVSNCLWVSNSGPNPFVHNNVTNGTKRILRIRNPLGPMPLRIDMVIGQSHKTNYIANHGRGDFEPDARGFAQPNQLALDNYRNLYVVDGSYEGRFDRTNDTANLRVVRFDAAVLNPVPGNLFPLPAANAVFCKTAMTSNRTEVIAHRPNTPIQIGFGVSNEMLLSVCGYGNEQGERVFYYPTPQLGAHPEPTHVLNTHFGQAAVCLLDGTSVIMQDHTWNRVLFHVPRATAPYMDITNAAIVTTGTTTALGGTTANIVGTLHWYNEAGGGGALPAAAQWQIPVVALHVGPNLIVVSGTNATGIVGSDSVTITRNNKK
ncbi:MAG: hypothetical protein NTV22_04280 [bacterium]|nr:hypothetical protein [bacterium]